MLRKALALKIFDAFSLQRWNDQLRPCEFTEMDKHAHKMIVAYILGKLNEDKGENVNWTKIINGGIYELFRRIALTDIKAPIRSHIKNDNPKLYEKINEWIYDQFEPIIDDSDFKKDFRDYLLKDNYLDPLSNKILKAAHIFTSYWELKKIEQIDPSGFGISRIKSELEATLDKYKDVYGLTGIINGEMPARFIDLCGQLRFQIRWGHIPRIPKTSVLGHMLCVAIYSHLLTISSKSCAGRRYNNFFGGLFHDLPEAVTRDIISPVKRSAKGLDSYLKEVERLFVEKEVFPLIDPKWEWEIKYFTENEFHNKIVEKGIIAPNVSSDEIDKKYNSDSYKPIDGEIIKCADELSAYIEAYKTNRMGITSEAIVACLYEIKDKYKDQKRLQLGSLYRDFE
jgi:putative hydrolases of HD superfamily